MEQKPLPLGVGAERQHRQNFIQRFPLADQFFRGGAVGQAALGADYVLVTLAPVPIPLTLPVKFPIVPSRLFQIVRNLGADLNGHEPPVDFDGNFHRPFLRSDFWGLNGEGGERQRGRCRWPGITKTPGRHKAIRVQLTTL